MINWFFVRANLDARKIVMTFLNCVGTFCNAHKCDNIYLSWCNLSSIKFFSILIFWLVWQIIKHAADTVWFQRHSDSQFQFGIDQFVPSERELQISRKSTKLSAKDVWQCSAQVSISNQIANTHSINCSFHVTLGQVKWKCLAEMMAHFNGMGREFHVYRQKFVDSRSTWKYFIYEWQQEVLVTEKLNASELRTKWKKHTVKMKW